jgi:hypothetical protein
MRTPGSSWLGRQRLHPRCRQLCCNRTRIAAIPVIPKCSLAGIHNDNCGSGDTAAATLEAAATLARGAVGLSRHGGRGLVASCDISAGDVVLRVPLCNTLLTPRCLKDASAAALAASHLHAWQKAHWALPQELARMLLGE